MVGSQSLRHQCPLLDRTTTESPFRFFHRLTVFSFVLLPSLQTTTWPWTSCAVIIHAEATEFNKSI